MVHKPIVVDDLVLALKAEEYGAVLVAGESVDAADVISTTLTAAGFSPYVVRGRGARPGLHDIGADIDAVVVDADATVAHGSEVLSQVAGSGRPIVVLLVAERVSAGEGKSNGSLASSVTGCFSTALEPETLLAAVRGRAALSAGGSP
jgi:hypothetical protein